MSKKYFDLVSLIVGYILSVLISVLEMRVFRFSFVLEKNLRFAICFGSRVSILRLNKYSRSLRYVHLFPFLIFSGPNLAYFVFRYAHHKQFSLSYFFYFRGTVRRPIRVNQQCIGVK